MTDTVPIGLAEETPRCVICGAPFYACVTAPEGTPWTEREGWHRRVEDGTAGGPCPPPQPAP